MFAVWTEVRSVHKSGSSTHVRKSAFKFIPINLPFPVLPDKFSLLFVLSILGKDLRKAMLWRHCLNKASLHRRKVIQRCKNANSLTYIMSLSKQCCELARLRHRYCKEHWRSHSFKFPRSWRGSEFSWIRILLFFQGFYKPSAASALNHLFYKSYVRSPKFHLQKSPEFRSLWSDMNKVLRR